MLTNYFSKQKDINPEVKICETFWNRKEPTAHFQNAFFVVFGSSVGDNGFENTLKWHCRKLC